MRRSIRMVGLMLLLSAVSQAQESAKRSDPTAAALRRSSSQRGPSSPEGAWLGQDGHDLVGPSSVLEPSGVQDIHIRLKGLPTGRAIESGSIKGLGGDEWLINGPFGPCKAAVVPGSTASTADLYLEPTRVETGRSFQRAPSVRRRGGRRLLRQRRQGRSQPSYGKLRPDHSLGGTGRHRPRRVGALRRARRQAGCSYRAGKTLSPSGRRFGLDRAPRLPRMAIRVEPQGQAQRRVDPPGRTTPNWPTSTSSPIATSPARS